MPGLTVAQDGAHETWTQITPPQENISGDSRSSEEGQERQDGPQDGPAPADPSATAASPEASPEPSADIRVRLNDDPALGFCVFALRRYEHGEVLYTERTALEATHDVYKEGTRDVHQVYRRCTDTRKNKLHGSFPHLAWANNVDPYEAAECRHLIASNLITKNVRIDNQLSAADHIRMRPDSALVLGGAGARAARAGGEGQHESGSAGSAGSAARTASPASARSSGAGSRPSGSASPVARAVSVFSSILSPFTKLSIYGSAPDTANAEAVADAAAAATNRLRPPTTRKAAQAETVAWFSRYAFRLDPQDAFPNTGQNHQAAVYLLTDLINHRCNRMNNCRVKTEMGKASLIAEKTIMPGEELTINYNKDIKDFVCRAECCAPSSASS